MTAPEAFTSRWRMAVQSLNRPYPVSIPMVVLVSLVPAYIFIAEWVATGRVTKLRRLS